jgi:hypothetical protein
MFGMTFCFDFPPARDSVSFISSSISIFLTGF